MTEQEVIKSLEGDVGKRFWSEEAQCDNWSEEFLDEYKNKMNWNWVGKLYADVDWTKFYSYINWRQLDYSNIYEPVIEENIYRVHWHSVSAKKFLHINFIRKHEMRIVKKNVLAYNESIDEYCFMELMSSKEDISILLNRKDFFSAPFIKYLKERIKQ